MKRITENLTRSSMLSPQLRKLAFIVLFCCVPFTMFGQTVISDEAGLKSIANDLGGSYQLTADIHLTEAWVPIAGFTGTLDGNGHIIYGLTFNDANFDKAAMFTTAIGATIKKLGIEDANIVGNADVAAIVGEANSTTITECYVANSYLEGRDHVASIVGKATAQSSTDALTEINNCYSSATLHSRSYQTGGIAGVMLYANITNNYFAGVITNNTNSAGIVSLVDTDSGLGSIENNLCLAPYIQGSVPYRIFANERSSETITRANNYGWAQTLVGTSLSTLALVASDDQYYGDTKRQGADCADPFDQNFYANTLKWDMSKWKFLGTDLFPVLAWQTTPVKASILGFTAPTAPMLEEDNYIARAYGSLGETIEWTSSNEDVAYYYAPMNGIYAASPGDVTIKIEPTTTNANVILDPVSFNLTVLSKDALNNMPINSLQDFLNISNELRGHYILNTDLDLSGIASWTPIGSDSNPFVGGLDGQGHTITGLTRNTPNDNEIGLFGYSSGATFKNLGLKNVNIVGSSNVGPVTAVSNGCTFDQVYTTGYIEGNDHVGGFTAQATGNQTTITNCYVDADVVTRSSQCGGFVGSVSNCTIDKSYFAGTVIAPVVNNGGKNAGGILCLLETTGNNLTNSVCAATKIQGGTTGKLVCRGVTNGMTTLTNNYYNATMDISDPIDTPYPDITSIAKSILDLQKKATYEGLGWDFTNIWTIQEGKSFPLLKNVTVPTAIQTIESDRTYNVSSSANQIIVTGLQNATVTVYNINGMQIAQKNNLKENVTIPVSAQGIYLVRIAENGKTVTMKIAVM